MNTKFAAALTGLTMAVTLFSTGGAAAYNAVGNFAAFERVTHTAALTPLSMQYFCAKHRNECAGGGSSKVTMSSNLLAVLKQVNGHVNRSIRPQRDNVDSWELNPTSGDCEDYVLSKRSALVRNGVSAGALRIAYTHTRRGEPHAVLVVRTSEGDLVLDNLTDSIKTLRASGYNIRSMSSPNPSRWTAG
ncbi:transglutaminase-like cysteine peptidase [Devosia chinhatensis]|uniref:transglutaminase-like cysteine peptidase n=1 Tax=Devosia chinhatensis TaxID=429727 RepID=UPI00069703BD|nr:transglutaminase-like cysteine peptidase [Devosia chinhatensis]